MSPVVPTAVRCKGKCICRHACVCSSGHKAPHICNDPDCACHAPGNYGLALNVRRGLYVREGESVEVQP